MRVVRAASFIFLAASRVFLLPTRAYILISPVFFLHCFHDDRQMFENEEKRLWS